MVIKLITRMHACNVNCQTKLESNRTTRRSTVTFNYGWMNSGYMK